MMTKKTVLKTTWKVFLTLLLTISLQNGLTQESTVLDSLKTDTLTYTFTGEQIKELLKASYELDECNKTVELLDLLVDEAQFKINVLDKFIHEKNLKIVNLKKWRNFGITIGIAGVIFAIIK